MRFAVPQAAQGFLVNSIGFIFLMKCQIKGVPVTKAFTIDDLKMIKIDWTKCA
jgi:hypothetical protein